jgi:hypothetical protein
MEERTISFIHLYDTHFGHFPKDKRDWIVFPQDFIPSTKKKYKCHIQWTMFGSFIFNKKRYNVARAYPKDHGSFMDVIENRSVRSRELWKNEKPKKHQTAMEIAMQKARKEKNV